MNNSLMHSEFNETTDDGTDAHIEQLCVYTYTQNNSHVITNIIGTRESLERLHKMLSSLIGDVKSFKSVSDNFKSVNKEDHRLILTLASAEDIKTF